MAAYRLDTESTASIQASNAFGPTSYGGTHGVPPWVVLAVAVVVVLVLLKRGR